MRESAFGDRFHTISSDPENDEKRLNSYHLSKQPFLKKHSREIGEIPELS
jgi:hypothetical protein